MEIFGRLIKRNSKEYFTLPVGELAHQAVVQMPVIVVSGKTEGPVLWLNGAVHGDELNGSYGAWELSRELNTETLKGTVVITPLCNPLAFECRKKTSDLDGLDMDTLFPGDPEGLFSQRIAYLIYEEIRRNATALINFHTMSTPYQSNPYSVRKLVPGVEDQVNVIAEGMQKAFGVETNCLVDLAGTVSELPGVTNGALDITCLKDGIPAFMGEMGQGGKIERTYIDVAKQGIRNVMIYLKMMNGSLSLPKQQVLITKRRFLRTDKGGLMTIRVKPGEIAKAEETLFKIHYWGEESGICSLKTDGYIIGVRENPVVATGDRVAFIGTEWRIWE